MNLKTKSVRHKTSVTVGSLVTCKVQEKAWYTGERGTPAVHFTPGMIGVIGAADVPYVMTPGGRDRSFVCVDFVAEGKEYRTGLDYNNLKLVKGA